MCLVKDKRYHVFNRPLIAEEDIVCYKQLYVNYMGEITTPYTNTPIPIKCIQKNQRKRVPFKAEILNKFGFVWNHVLGFSNIVEDGFIHTFSFAPCYLDLSRNERIFKCIIPKGTKYFIGNDDDYASEQIIIGDRLK